jgi:hypothetical protein
MRPMPVVLVGPGFEVFGSLFCVLIEPRIGPRADGGLEETLGLTVGTRCVDACPDMLEPQAAVGVAEQVGRADSAALP